MFKKGVFMNGMINVMINLLKEALIILFFITVGVLFAQVPLLIFSTRNAHSFLVLAFAISILICLFILIEPYKLRLAIGIGVLGFSFIMYLNSATTGMPMSLQIIIIFPINFIFLLFIKILI